MGFDRTRAIIMEIKDPDALCEDDGIVQLLTLEHKLYAFKGNGIFEVLPPETIDPDNQHPETRPTNEKVYSVGLKDALVARMIIQFRDIIDLLPATKENRVNAYELKEHVWKANKLLLNCEKLQYEIYQETLELMPKCDAIVEANKNASYIPALPKIEKLDTLCENFLSNAKKFLVAAYELLNFFYAYPSDNPSNFQVCRENLEKQIGANHPVTDFLRVDEQWVKIISGMRNALEHPRKGNTVTIENFKLRPGNKISTPCWKYDLTDKVGIKQDDLSDIVLDMNAFIEDMLTYFEVLIVLCISDMLGEKSFLEIVRFPTEKINPQCPVLYIMQRKLAASSDS